MKDEFDGLKKSFVVYLSIEETSSGPRMIAISRVSSKFTEKEKG